MKGAHLPFLPPRLYRRGCPPPPSLLLLITAAKTYERQCSASLPALSLPPSLGPSLSPAEREGVLGRARGCPICLSDWRRTPGTAEGGRRGNERAALNLVHRLI